MALLDNEGPGGEYAAAAPEKKKLSRARKALIGLLVVGAVGAVAGGGTFASFTASTDNRSADDPFQAENLMVLGNTVVDGPGAAAGQCRSDEEGTTFVEENIAADAVRCDFLFTDQEVEDLAAGATITSDIILENLSVEEDDVTGIPGKLLWAAVDEEYEGCVGIDDGDDDILETADDSLIEFGSGTYSSATLCDNIVLTIEEYAHDAASDGFGDRGTNGATPAKSIDLSDMEPIGNQVAGDTRCVFPRAVANSHTTPCTSIIDATDDHRIEDLPRVFDEVDSLIDADFDPTAANSNVGQRFFRVSARLVGTDICTSSNDSDGDNIVDATGQGCSNGAEGNAKFTLRWVLVEKA